MSLNVLYPINPDGTNGMHHQVPNQDASTPAILGSARFERMNEDVLFQVTLYLDPMDIFALKQTCKSLFSLCSLRSVWFQAANSLIAQSIQFPFRDAVDISSLSPIELQSAVLHAWTLDSNICSTSIRSHLCIPTRLQNTDSDEYIGYLKGPFKMLGCYFILLTTNRGVYIYDIRQPKYAQDSIPFLSENLLTQFSVQFLGNGKLERMARLGLGILEPRGTPVLNIYDIYTNEYQTAEDSYQPSMNTCPEQKARQTAYLKLSASFILRAPLKQMVMGNDAVFGLMNLPPFGALWVCDLKNGATGIFQMLQPSFPLSISIASDHILLSSHNESNRSIFCQLIPQALFLRQLSNPQYQGGENALNKISDPSKHSPEPRTDPSVMLTPNHLENITPSSDHMPIPRPQLHHPLPPPSCSFVYPCLGMPALFFSGWVTLSETIPIVSDIINENGMHIVNRWHLKFVPPNKRGASEGISRGGGKGRSEGSRCSNIPPTAPPIILIPGSNAYLLPNSSTIPDSLLTEKETDEPLATLEVVEHSEYTSMQALGDVAIMGCGTMIRTRQDESDGRPIAIEVVVWPIRAAGIAAREGGGDGPTIVGEKLGANVVTGGGRLMVKDIPLPKDLALEDIIEMDIEDVTGRLMVALSNGEVWILSFL